MEILDSQSQSQDTERFENQILAAKGALMRSMADALEHGIPLARILELLGVEGKAAVMLRAFVSRMDSDELVQALRSLENIPPMGDAGQ